MNLRPYKFLIVPVLQRLDADGLVVGEVSAQEQPDVVFGVDRLVEYAQGFEDALARIVDDATEVKD